MKKRIFFSIFLCLLFIVVLVNFSTAGAQDPTVVKFSVSPFVQYDFTDVAYVAEATPGITFPPSTIDWVNLYVKVNSGYWYYYSMLDIGEDLFRKEISGDELVDEADGGDTIYYYFKCKQSDDKTDTTEVFSCVLEVDNPPVISDVVQGPVSGTVSYLDDLVNITCTVIDDISILYVKIYYTVNYDSGSSSDNDVMENLSGDVYNYLITNISYNVLVSYIIYSSDENANYAETEEYSFTPEDFINPDIVSVEYDAEFTFSIDEHFIFFVVVDDHPDNYVLYCNSVIFKEGSFDNNSKVSLDITDFTEGDYDFELIVYDLSLNEDNSLFSISVVAHVLDVPDIVLPVVYNIAPGALFATTIGTLFFAITIIAARRITKKKKK